MVENKWIIDGHHYTCPECGNIMAIVENESDEGFDFCPFCGKRMSGQIAENKMEKYDGVNNSWGTTTIKVLFQVDEYKGAMTYKIEGNCKGLSALPHDGMSIIDNLETAGFKDMNIIPYDDGDWFAKVFLTKNFNNTLEYDIESEAEFENMIVGMQIIDFTED